MSLNAAALESLRRVFYRGFSVRDIAEPLVSFDDSSPAATVRAYMTERQFEAVGVRRNGLVAGFVERSSLGDGPCSDFLQPFDESYAIPDATPLADVIVGLNDRPRLFVSLLGAVDGIVTRSDLQKPPVRMWLFGMVTLIEMRLTRMIEMVYPDGGWEQYLSDSRLDKAEQLLAERARRHQELELLDCVQFSDKAQIIARNERLRNMTRYESRRQFEQATKLLERLRNNLAHAQDIISSDWDAILQLSENLDQVLEGPPGLHREIAD